jgi:hypothetical protein
LVIGGLELEGMDQGLGDGILLGDWLKEACDCKLVAASQNDYDGLRGQVVGVLYLSMSDPQLSELHMQPRDLPISSLVLACFGASTVRENV